MLTPGPRLANAAARILRSMRQPDMFEQRCSRTRPRHLSEGFEQIVASFGISERALAPTGCFRPKSRDQERATTHPNQHSRGF